MRKRAIWVLGAMGAIGLASAAVAMAGGEKPITVRSGNLILTIGGNVHPSTLPKFKLAPVTFNPHGTISTADGSHPPAVKEFVLDAGPGGTVEADKFPKCRIGQIEAQNPKQAEAACPGAIVGHGHVKVEVEFAESAPFFAQGPLVLFNGGEKRGAAVTLIYSYVSVPVPTAIVATTLTTPERKGPYRLHVVGQVPKIAGGAGSVIHFDIDVNRKGYLLANCSDGHFSTRVATSFTEGPFLQGSFLKPCRGV